MTLHVLYSFPNRLGVSGIGITAWRQAAGLTSLGIKLTVMCGTCERPIPKVHRLIETARVVKLRIPYRLLGNDRVFRMHDAKVASFLSHSQDRPDVVHGWPLGSLQTLNVAKQLGVVSLMERPNTHTRFAYEVVRKECVKIGMKVPATSTHAFNAKRLAREEAEYERADYLACPSEFVRQSFLAQGISETKLVAHHYGYDPGTCFQAGDSTRNRAGLHVAFVGTCDPRKGLHYALDAWIVSHAAKHGKFEIYGKFVPGYREFLGSRLDHPSVSVFGFVSDVPDKLRQCDALILPSIEEGSALVTYEARACGCILVVSDAAGARCQHMENALVHAAGDVETLEQHLSLLSDDTALLARLRSNSIAGLAELTWERAALRLMNIYRQALASKVGAWDIDPALASG